MKTPLVALSLLGCCRGFAISERFPSAPREVDVGNLGSFEQPDGRIRERLREGDLEGARDAYSESHGDAALRCAILRAHVEAAEGRPEVARAAEDWTIRLDSTGERVEDQIKLHNMVLTAHSKSGDLARAEALLERMLYRGLVDEVSVTIVVSMHGKRGSGKEAIRLLLEMKRLGIKCSTYALNAVLKACVNVQDAEKILRNMETAYLNGSSDMKPDLISYSTVMNSLTKIHTPEALDRMERVFESQKKMCYEHDNSHAGPDLIAYQILIRGLCDGNRPDRAERVLREMFESDRAPNPTIWNVNKIIGSWGRRAERGGARAVELLEWAVEAYLESKNRRLQPDDITFLSAISAWNNSTDPKKIHRALGVLERMKQLHRDGVIAAPPSVKCYTNLIKVCSFGASTKKEQLVALSVARSTYREMMESNNCKPNAVTFSVMMTAIRKLSSRGKDQAVELAKVFRHAIEAGRATSRIVYLFETYVPHEYLEELVGSNNLKSDGKLDLANFKVRDMKLNDSDGPDAAPAIGDAVPAEAVAPIYFALKQGDLAHARNLYEGVYEKYGLHDRESRFAIMNEHASPHYAGTNAALEMEAWAERLDGSDEDRDMRCLLYNTILKAFAYSRDSTALQRAEALLGHMERMGIANAIAYAILATFYAQRGADRDGALLLERMNERNVTIDEHTVRSVMRVQIKDGNVNGAENLLALVMAAHSEGKVDVSPKWTNEMTIKALCGANQLDSAQRVVKMMYDKHRTSNEWPCPEIWMVNSVIGGWKKHEEDGAEKAEEMLEWAIRAYNETKNPSLQPDKISFLNALSVWSKSRVRERPLRARDLLERMKQLHRDGISKDLPDDKCYNSLITACSKTVKRQDIAFALKTAVAAYNELMTSDHCGPNTVTFLTVIVAVRNLAPQSEKRTTKLIDIYRQCVQADMVTLPTLAELQKSIPKEDLWKVAGKDKLRPDGLLDFTKFLPARPS